MKYFTICLCLCLTMAWAGFVERAYYQGNYADIVIVADLNHDGNLEIYDPVYPDLRVREYNDFNQISDIQLPYYAVPWDWGNINFNDLMDIVVQSGDPGMGGNGYLRIYEQRCPCSYPDSLIAEIVLPDRKVVYHAQYTDLDQDGKYEVLMSPNHFNGGGLRVYEWDNNQLNLVWEYVSDKQICRKATGDFNGNGKLEIVISENGTVAGGKSDQPVAGLTVNNEKSLSGGVPIRIFECTGDNSYQEIWSYYYPHSLCVVGPCFAFDFDGDGPQEFLACVSTHDIGYRYLIFKYENGSYNLWHDLGDNTGFIGYLSATVADFDQDDREEFVATIMPWWIRIYHWTENGVVYDSICHEGLGTYAADFDHDQWPDIYAVLFIGQTPNDDVKFYEYEATAVQELVTNNLSKPKFEINPRVGRIFHINCQSSREKILIYNHLGQLVQTVKPGTIRLSLPNGVYFVKTDKSQTIKITILK